MKKEKGIRTRPSREEKKKWDSQKARKGTPGGRETGSSELPLAVLSEQQLVRGSRS